VPQAFTRPNPFAPAAGVLCASETPFHASGAQITLVAKIISVQDTPTQVLYKVDDGTGAFGDLAFSQSCFRRALACARLADACHLQASAS
jgi:hypothetical protein